MYSRGLGVVVSNTDMVMGPNFSTQPITLPTLTQPNPYQRDYNSISPNTGCYNAINRETVITSFCKLFQSAWHRFQY